MLAAADASPKLVQLADAEPVGIHHHHHRRIRHVHADLDDGGAHQDIDLARAERRHHGVLLVAGQPTVHQAEAQSGELPAAQLFEEHHHRGGRRTLIVLGGLVALIDARCHDIRLATGADFFDDALPGPLQPRRLLLDEDRVGGDGLAAAREFAQRRRLEVAVDGERDGARNRRRRHHQQVRRQPVGSLGAQPVSLLNTEPVLFVDDDHAEPLELHRLLQQRVRADDDARIAARDLVAHLPLLLRRHGPGQQRDARRAVGAAQLARHRQRPEDISDGPSMLGGKDFRRRQQCALVSGVDHLQHGQHGDDGLARAHLTLQHAVHRPARRQFGRQHVEHFLLTIGQFERQLLAHRGQEAVVFGPRRRDRIRSVRRIAAPPTPIAARPPRQT